MSVGTSVNGELVGKDVPESIVGGEVGGDGVVLGPFAGAGDVAGDVATGVSVGAIVSIGSLVGVFVMLPSKSLVALALSSPLSSPTKGRKSSSSSTRNAPATRPPKSKRRRTAQQPNHMAKTRFRDLGFMSASFSFCCAGISSSPS